MPWKFGAELDVSLILRTDLPKQHDTLTPLQFTRQWKAGRPLPVSLPRTPGLVVLPAITTTPVRKSRRFRCVWTHTLFKTRSVQDASRRSGCGGYILLLFLQTRGLVKCRRVMRFFGHPGQGQLDPAAPDLGVDDPGDGLKGERFRGDP